MNNGPKLCAMYIVRHGETVWNTQKLMQGHCDSPLTEAGIQQAKDLAKKLRSIKFDAIYSSDLLRAKRTAEIIALEHKLAVMTTRLLRERSFGKYEGKSRNELKEFDKIFDRLNDAEKFSFSSDPGIESDEKIVARFITFLRETAVSHPEKTILVATHGGMMKALLIHIGFTTYRKFMYRKIGNTAYIKLKTDGVDFFVEETNGIDLPIDKI